MPRVGSACKSAGTRCVLAVGLLGVALGGASGASCSADDPCDEAAALDLFTRRIQPLLDADNPSSCNECHAAGVGLALYDRDDACTTMACMVKSGVVDLDDPDASLVLDWIDRATPVSSLITEETIAEEHDAVRDWIDVNARCGPKVCPDAIAEPCGDPPAADDCAIPASQHDLPQMPWEDPGDCSDRTLELMFQAKVYSWRGRCYPCHFADWDGDPPEAPRWIATGTCDVASVQTMHDVLERNLVDTAAPEQSLLLLKPLAESAGGVEHGGDDKFDSVDETAYLDFRAWIERWAQCKSG